MKIKYRLIYAALAVVCLLPSKSLTLDAKDTWPKAPEVITETAVLMEVNTGTVLYEKNAHETGNPASITKIMTALLAIEGCGFEEDVLFSYDSVHKTEGSSIWRDVDEVMTMEQCLYALMLNSANECAYAIAEHTEGDYEDFVKKMNERAKALGCTDTNFNNPHGLTDEEHYTSCYDMALIAGEAIQNDIFRQITGTVKYSIPPTNKHPEETTYLNNHHKMLLEDSEQYYEYCIGGKTGYTEAAGNTLVTFARKDGMTLVCVVMKEKQPNHYIDTRALLDYGFANFKLWNIAQNEKDLKQAPLPENDFLKSEDFVVLDTNSNIVLPANVDFADATAKILTDSKSADVAGTIQYTYDGKEIGKTDIKATGQKLAVYPFQEKIELQPNAKKVVLVKKSKIIWFAVGAIVIAVLAFFIFHYRERLQQIGFLLINRIAVNKKEIPSKQRRKRRRRR